MRYNPSDLGLFKLLRDPAQRDGTAYFEFHPAELPEPRACWLDGSLLMRDAAFDFFAGCFQAALPTFDYFAFSRFGEGDIARLLAELDAYLASVESNVTPLDALFARYASVFTQDIWADIEPTILAPVVAVAGHALRTYIAEQTRDSRCLWVLGM